MDPESTSAKIASRKRESASRIILISDTQEDHSHTSQDNDSRSSLDDDSRASLDDYSQASSCCVSPDANFEDVKKDLHLALRLLLEAEQEHATTKLALKRTSEENEVLVIEIQDVIDETKQLRCQLTNVTEQRDNLSNINAALRRERDAIAEKFHEHAHGLLSQEEVQEQLEMQRAEERSKMMLIVAELRTTEKEMQRLQKQNDLMELEILRLLKHKKNQSSSSLFPVKFRDPIINYNKFKPSDKKRNSLGFDTTLQHRFAPEFMVSDGCLTGSHEDSLFQSETSPGSIRKLRPYNIEDSLKSFKRIPAKKRASLGTSYTNIDDSLELVLEEVLNDHPIDKTCASETQSLDSSKTSRSSKSNKKVSFALTPSSSSQLCVEDKELSLSDVLEKNENNAEEGFKELFVAQHFRSEELSRSIGDLSISQVKFDLEQDLSPEKHEDVLELMADRNNLARKARVNDLQLSSSCHGLPKRTAGSLLSCSCHGMLQRHSEEKNSLESKKEKLSFFASLLSN